MFKSDKVSRKISRRLQGCLSAAPLVVVAAGLSVGAMQVQADEVTIKIKFESVETDGGDIMCPTGVSDPELILEKKNKTVITWVAYDATYGAEVEEEFAIYFDPFKNSSLESKNGQPKNRVISPKLGDIDVPAATYKYTILGTSCPDLPHDPRFIVR